MLAAAVDGSLVGCDSAWRLWQAWVDGTIAAAPACDGTRWAVLHGARHSWDLGYRSELQTLQGLFPNFDYIPVIDEPEKELIPWTGETGFVQQLWERGVIAQRWGFTPTPKDTHIFLCGNPLMIEGMIEVLGREGFVEQTKKRPGQIHLERYW